MALKRPSAIGGIHPYSQNSTQTNGKESSAFVIGHNLLFEECMYVTLSTTEMSILKRTYLDSDSV